jgi:hypothetical protein
MWSTSGADTNGSTELNRNKRSDNERFEIQGQVVNKAYICAIGLLLVAGCGGGGGDGGSLPPAVQRLLFSGGGALGIFDPSFAQETGSSRLWMSYSAVDVSQFYVPSVYWAVSTRLAFSDDSGATWQDAGVVVSPFGEHSVGPLTVTSPVPPIPASSDGIWQSETSTLIYDLGAPAAERWKVFYMQYLHAAGFSHFLDYNWIAMRAAATPQDLSGATAVKLFAGFGLQSDGEVTTAPAFSPIGGPPVIRLNSDLTNAASGVSLSELNNCVFAEPGLRANVSAIHMVMLCSDPVADKEYIVQFRCASPCTVTTAASWAYLGRVLTPADAAAATGFDHYSAPDIVESAGRYYLIVTPVPAAGGYRGCRVYEYTDIDTGTLARDGGGVPIEVLRVTGEAGTHHGACSGRDGLLGGILLSQYEPANPPETFRMYKSQVSLP